MLDFDEDEMLNISAAVVPCRGREARLDTDRDNDFTARELDELAPLAPGDAKDLGEHSTPSSETLARVEKRIKAARRLKYGS